MFDQSSQHRVAIVSECARLPWVSQQGVWMSYDHLSDSWARSDAPPSWPAAVDELSEPIRCVLGRKCSSVGPACRKTRPSTSMAGTRRPDHGCARRERAPKFPFPAPWFYDDDLRAWSAVAWSQSGGGRSWRSRCPTRSASLNHRTLLVTCFRGSHPARSADCGACRCARGTPLGRRPGRVCQNPCGAYLFACAHHR